MSYSISVPAGPVDTLSDRIDEAAAPALEQVDAESRDAAREAVDNAKEALIDLAESGTIVKEGQHCSATISGHANPDHEPRGGYSNDAVTISLTQVAATEGA